MPDATKITPKNQKNFWANVFAEQCHQYHEKSLWVEKNINNTHFRLLNLNISGDL